MMKRLCIVLFSLLIVPVSLRGQDSKRDFEGKIIYSIEYLQFDSAIEDYVERLPKKSTLYIKGNLSRLEQAGMPGVKQIFIGNSKTSSAIIAMKFREKDFFVQLDSSSFDLNKTRRQQSVVSEHSEVEILGYPCKKITSTASGDTTISYVTARLPSTFALLKHGGLAGLPLRYQVNTGGTKMRLRAIKVEERSLSDSLFAAPPGVTEMPAEKFREIFSQ